MKRKLLLLFFLVCVFGCGTETFQATIDTKTPVETNMYVIRGSIVQKSVIHTNAVLMRRNDTGETMVAVCDRKTLDELEEGKTYTFTMNGNEIEDIYIVE